MKVRPNRFSGKYMSEINVTPLVDVILVLLIIFMVTAPMMTKGLGVKLPEVTAKPIPQKQRTVKITVVKNGTVYLNEVKVDTEVLKNKLAQLKMDNKAQQILLMADRSVPYGKVARVIAAVREAGILDLGLVTKAIEIKHPPKKTSRHGN